MDHTKDIRYLLVILLLVSLGILLVNASFLDKGIVDIVQEPRETIYLANAFYAPGFVLLYLLAFAVVRLRLPHADPFILPVIALLSGLGFIMILRLSPDLTFARSEALRSLLNANPHAKVTDNLITLSQLGIKYFTHMTLGILVMVLTIFGLNNRGFSWLSSKKYLWVMISVAVVLVTLLMGVEINGRRLWLFGFQTVELVKVLMLLFIAGYLYEHWRGIVFYRESGNRFWLKYSGPFVAMWFFALIPLYVQKDLGPVVLIFIVFLLMFFYAGNRNAITLIFISVLVVVGYLSYQIGYPHVVRERFDALFDPFNNSEAMTRVLWSLSSGGWMGTGIGYGEPYRMPEVQSDFSFAAICEEMGFIGGCAVILAYALFIFRCFHISLKVDNRYQKMIIIGIATLMAVQTSIIILGNLVVIPLTGITLPFISYGGSSLIVNFLMAGIVICISNQQSEVKHE